jgi:hypothetical protein
MRNVSNCLWSVVLSITPTFLAGSSPSVGLRAAEVTDGGGRTLSVAESQHALIEGEIKRIARDIQVSSREDEATAFELLKGPLLHFEAKPSFIYGTVWAWGGPGRPQAVLSLALCGSPDEPQWLQEIVSLSDKPMRAAVRGRVWWSTEMSGWNPKPIPSADAPAENAEQRLAQMRDLAQRFTGWWFQDPNQPWEMERIGEPIYRYRDQTPGALDGAVFAFVGAVNNPEILLVIEAEKDGEGRVQWKFEAARMAACGLIVRLDDKETWRRGWLDHGREKPSDPYYLRFISAEAEIRGEEGKAGEPKTAGHDPFAS